MIQKHSKCKFSNRGSGELDCTRRAIVCLVQAVYLQCLAPRKVNRDGQLKKHFYIGLQPQDFILPKSVSRRFLFSSILHWITLREHCLEPTLKIFEKPYFSLALQDWKVIVHASFQLNNFSRPSHNIPYFFFKP